jgi:hypothetical protein
MLLRTVAAAMCLSALPLAPAVAAEMVDSDFQVTFNYGGSEQRLSETQVPLLPGNTCYTWWMKLAAGDAPSSVVEKLVLPEALADWGDAATNPDDGVEISADGTTATSTFAPELDSEGWFSKGWCAAVGDPLGPHKIEVSVDGTLLKTYDFEVLAPEDYPWPALRQPDTSERSVQDSW